MAEAKREQIILVDVQALNDAAFRIIVNFERMLNRRLPKVDMRKWLYAAAIDGGFKRSEPDVEVRLLMSGSPNCLDFSEVRGNAAAGKPFQEGGFNFKLTATSGDSHHDDYFAEELCRLLERHKSAVKMVCVPSEDICQYIARLAGQYEDASAAILTQAPLRGGGFNQEFISCSLCYALGITDEEIREKSMAGRGDVF